MDGLCDICEYIKYLVKYSDIGTWIRYAKWSAAIIVSTATRDGYKSTESQPVECVEYVYEDRALCVVIVYSLYTASTYKYYSTKVSRQFHNTLFWSIMNKRKTDSSYKPQIYLTRECRAALSSEGVSRRNVDDRFRTTMRQHNSSGPRIAPSGPR